VSRRTARRLRRVVQFGFLLFFLVVGFATFQSFTPGRAAEGLFPFDPLAALTAMLAGRTWITGMAWAFGTLALTVVLGRVWCGWICPLGTTLEYVRFKSATRREARISPRWRTVKYVLLATIVVMAAFGSLSFLVLDPITIFNRTVATAVVPLIDGAVRGIESLAGDVSWLSGAVDWVNTSVRGTVLPRTQPFFWQGIVIGGIFVAVMALNLLADRFWCRYLCPLGALLGAFSKFALFRPLVNESCSGCRRCASACRLGAIEVADVEETPAATEGDPADAAITPAAEHAPAAAASGARCPGGGTTVVTSECTMCLDCLVACPDGASMRFGRARTTGPWQPYDPGRREVLASTVLGVGAVALLGTGPWQGERPRAVLRPPGVTDEDDFLSTCLRCGACVSVCPTSGLQPAGGQAGAAGFWTPVLEPRRGYCEYTCNACGTVCPSDAIPALRLSSKRQAVIGTAIIDRTRCLPWSKDIACVICNEVCPVPGNAVRLGQGKTVVMPDGLEEFIAYPVVRPGRCIGCGTCENACPVAGVAAITVRPLAELPPSSEGGSGQGQGGGQGQAGGQGQGGGQGNGQRNGGGQGEEWSEPGQEY